MKLACAAPQGSPSSRWSASAASSFAVATSSALIAGLGIEAVILCLDNDDAGRAATARAIENAARARQSPEVYVIDPRRLAPAKDPDELVRDRGMAAWREALDGRQCSISWRARELADVTRNAPVSERRAALARAGRWQGTLPPRLALEQEDALRAVADQCGYSATAVERAFPARFFRERAIERDRLARVREHGIER